MIIKVNNSLKKEAVFLGLRISNLVKLLVSFIVLLSASAALGVLDLFDMTYLVVGSLCGTLVVYVYLRVAEKRFAPHYLDRLFSYRFNQPKKLKS